MKNIGEWVIIKALNKNEELVVKFENNKFYITIASYSKNNVLIVDGDNAVIIDDYNSLYKLLDNIEKVMSNKDNKLWLYDGYKKSQDIHLRLIKYNSAFKLKDTLKIELYSYIGVNSSQYSSITISKESSKNLYKAILIAIGKIKIGDN